MDLVDDHRVDVDQRVGDRRRQHQVQAFWRRDEQIDRMANQSLTILRRCVAGAHGHRGLMEVHTEPLGRKPDAHQRGAKVLFDVEGQGAQRRDVQHPCPTLRIRRLRVAQPVDRCEKCSQGLAAAGGRAHQRVVAAENRRPAIDLRCRRCRKRRCEPSSNCRRERLEHGVISHVARLGAGCYMPSFDRPPARVEGEPARRRRAG